MTLQLLRTSQMFVKMFPLKELHTWGTKLVSTKIVVTLNPFSPNLCNCPLPICVKSLCFMTLSMAEKFMEHNMLSVLASF